MYTCMCLTLEYKLKIYSCPPLHNEGVLEGRGIAPFILKLALNGAEWSS